MWKPYFDAIFYKLFVPYLCYMATFTIYATALCYYPWSDGITIWNFLKVLCVCVFGPLYVQ